MMGAWDYRYNVQGGALPHALQGVAGAVTARYAYDPFGKRRFTNGTYDAFGTLVVDWTSNTNAGTDRGYTGHEHLDDVGLVHMNGRIFDPTLGVFLQGDPFIQDPGNLQNYNRYGYCYNNPLTCTDPSGQDFGFGHLLVLVYMAWVADQMPEFRPYVAIFAAVVLGPAGGAFEGGAAAYGMSQAATAGFVSGAIASGNLQGALQGAFTAGMFNGVGNLIEGGNFFSGGVSEAARLGTEAGIALHAVVGCVTSVAGGGKCGPGAMSAAFSKAFAGEIMSKAGDAGVIASAVIGGTASVLGGGKFASGAMSGAFSYLFNDAAHEVLKNRSAGIKFETAVVKDLIDAGYRVATNVEIKFMSAGGELTTAIADFMYMRGDDLIVGELKWGLGAKLSVGQKTVYDAILTGKDVAISPNALRTAGISDDVYRVAAKKFELYASEVTGRAGMQAARRWGALGFRALKWVTPAAQVAIEAITYTKGLE